MNINNANTKTHRTTLQYVRVYIYITSTQPHTNTKHTPIFPSQTKHNQHKINYEPTHKQT